MENTSKSLKLANKNSQHVHVVIENILQVAKNALESDRVSMESKNRLMVRINSLSENFKFAKLQQALFLTKEQTNMKTSQIEKLEKQSKKKKRRVKQILLSKKMTGMDIKKAPSDEDDSGIECFKFKISTKKTAAWGLNAEIEYSEFHTHLKVGSKEYDLEPKEEDRGPKFTDIHKTLFKFTH